MYTSSGLISGELSTNIKTYLLIIPTLTGKYLGFKLLKKMSFGDFPGGAVVKNPPANAGDTGLSPGPGRYHMLRSNWACASQLLSLCSRAGEPQLLSPHATTTEACVPRARAPQQEKPLQ